MTKKSQDRWPPCEGSMRALGRTEQKGQWMVRPLVAGLLRTLGQVGLCVKTQPKGEWGGDAGFPEEEVPFPSYAQGRPEGGWCPGPSRRLRSFLHWEYFCLNLGQLEEREKLPPISTGAWVFKERVTLHSHACFLLEL